MPKFAACSTAILLSISISASSYAASAAGSQGWQQYGGPGGRHYATLTQITPANVDGLRVTWIYHTGDTGAGFDPARNEGQSHMAFEATPILYDGMLYFTTTDTNVVALDAASG